MVFLLFHYLLVKYEFRCLIIIREALIEEGGRGRRIEEEEEEATEEIMKEDDKMELKPKAPEIKCRCFVDDIRHCHRQ